MADVTWRDVTGCIAFAGVDLGSLRSASSRSRRNDGSKAMRPFGAYTDGFNIGPVFNYRRVWLWEPWLPWERSSGLQHTCRDAKSRIVAWPS